MSILMADHGKVDFFFGAFVNYQFALIKSEKKTNFL